MQPTEADRGPVVEEGDELKGENTVIINAEGRKNDVTIVVNGIKQEFGTRKEITVSDAQLVALRNSGLDVTEVKVSKKAKDSSTGEAGEGEGSPSSAAGEAGKSKAAPAPKGKAKSAAKTPAPKAEPASNVNDGGNTTKTADGEKNEAK